MFICGNVKMLKCLNVKMSKGFTIIEFLIVISIIGIFSVITIPNYRSAQQQLALQRSASKLAQDIRRAQEMAMSTEELSTGDLPEGYGVYIDKGESDRYYIYADINGNERYDSGEEQGEAIYLEKEVCIETFVPPSVNFSINFKPPDPVVKMKNQAGEDKKNVTITIALKANPLRTKNIIVNEAGLIYVE